MVYSVHTRSLKPELCTADSTRAVSCADCDSGDSVDPSHRCQSVHHQENSQHPNTALKPLKFLTTFRKIFLKCQSKVPRSTVRGPAATLTFVTDRKDLDHRQVDRSINAHTPEVQVCRNNRLLPTIRLRKCVGTINVLVIQTKLLCFNLIYFMNLSASLIK